MGPGCLRGGVHVGHGYHVGSKPGGGGANCRRGRTLEKNKRRKGEVEVDGQTDTCSGAETGEITPARL